MATVNMPADVVALERGEDASTVPTWAYPKVVDEIAQSARNGLLQNLSKTTVTIRHSKDERAVPYREIGSFSRAREWVVPASTGQAFIRV